MTALELAISEVGGITKLARAIGVSTTAPCMWKARSNVPAEHCPAIERVTLGVVTCEDLRPDVEWKVLRLSVRPVAAKKLAGEIAGVGMGVSL